ncbi:Protein roadkill like protein [Argiope bruennichi]|uniref:Protein roadkill like protein n=1 Tax=Argiope bruennichi TaxID=94029 RepID=A0A8T0ENJ8_ARGBR|nr:Protein roadkill like protein [Argiope bruennichi]
MLDLEKIDEIKCYEFSWELIGYDCGPPKIRSPNFTVNFQVTEWYMELDLSKLQNVDSSIPFRLQRIPDIGPNAVTLDVKITVKLSENKDFSLEKSQTAKVFSEKMENYWAFDIDIPSQKLESKDEDLTWLTSKNMTINVEMKNSKRTDPVFPKKYWCSKSSLTEVVRSLKKLYDEGYHHDLVLKVSGEEFLLHKSILNARWPKLMSTLKINESAGEVETKEFSGISPAVLKLLLQFAYYGDWDFMFHLEENDDTIEIFNAVKKYNFYRLNDKITQLSPKCSSSQILQSYRTPIQMKFTNVTSKDMAMGDFRTCNIPLKPRIVHRTPEADSLDTLIKEKSQEHIKFLDLRLYVDKGQFGYNWLMFSITLGKLPQNNPVTIQCKLYVIGQSKKNYLLTEQSLVFDRSTEVSFTTPLSEGKICKRYVKTSEPVIRWRELKDESRDFMQTRQVPPVSSGEAGEEKDIFFRFELKLTDYEQAYDMRHGECQLEDFDGDFKIFRDLELVYNDETFTDIKVTSEDRAINANKAILAVRSEVLGAILLENPNLKSLPISIEPDNLQLFIHYLYTGQIHKVPAEKIDNLLAAADKYKMECLRDILIRSEESIVTEVIA